MIKKLKGALSSVG